ENIPFTAHKNDLVVGTIASNVSVNFYIMSETQFQQWVSVGYCPSDYSNVNAVYIGGRITSSYNLNYVIPSDGNYQFLFITQVTASGTGIEFDATLNSNGQTILAFTTNSLS